VYKKGIKKHKHNQNWPAENRRKTHRKEIEDKKVGLVAFFTTSDLEEKSGLFFDPGTCKGTITMRTEMTTVYSHRVAADAYSC